MNVDLLIALRVSDVPGHQDVMSGLDKVYLTSVDAWYPALHDLQLNVGKLYRFRDRLGRETEFMALPSKPPGMFTETERLAHVEAAGNVSYEQGVKNTLAEQKKRLDEIIGNVGF